MKEKEYKEIARNEWEGISGPLLTKEEVWARLGEIPEVYAEFAQLSEELQQELVAFAMGIQGIKMTYDPFFKHIFDPILRPEVLEEFLGACFREEVKIVEVLPNESRRLTDESSLLIADLLVRLESGAIVNVEIQRIGYYFPGARCACYSSDLVMRQYSQIRMQRRREKKRFSYGDVKKVYTVVLMQKSTREFHELPDEYLHYAKQTFKSGLEMDLLQEYLLIPLDIFLKIPHDELSRLEAWLYFIASDKMCDIKKVCDTYPDFCELYREIFRFRYHPKELVSMFSEALRILDQDTVQYMIDDMRNELEAGRAEIEANKAELEANKAELEANKAELEANKAELEANKAELEASKVELEASKVELEASKVELEASKVELEASKVELEASKVELEASKVELEASKVELEVSKVELEANKAELEASKEENIRLKAELARLKEQLSNK